MAILLCGNLDHDSGRGLDIALVAFDNGIPGGRYLLTAIVACFAISSMFSYSFYGRRCAEFMFGQQAKKPYLLLFILSLVLFAVVPLQAAVGLCDMFYALMAFPTMIMLVRLRNDVRAESRRYFNNIKESEIITTQQI